MTNENETTTSPFGTWWWVSAGFLVLLAIVATIVFVTGDRPDEAIAMPSSTEGPGPEPSTAAEPGEEGGACELPADDQDIPTTGPTADWVPVDYLMVPTSTVYGPADAAGSSWPCFAHSPTGALLAAVHFTAAMYGSEYERLAEDAAVPSAALDLWLADQDPSSRTQTAGQVAQFAGYRYVELAPSEAVVPDRVVVDLAMRQSSVEGYIRIALVWDAERETWRGDMTATQLDPTFEEITSTNFTSWSAVE